MQHEIIVKVGRITSDPFFNFKDLNAISRATDPLETVAENFLSTKLANFFSNFFTYGPSEEIHPVLIQFNKYFFHYPEIKAY